MNLCSSWCKKTRGKKQRKVKICLELKGEDMTYSCTVELQWLEHLWNHENMFETAVVYMNVMFNKYAIYNGLTVMPDFCGCLISTEEFMTHLTYIHIF